MSLKRYVLTIVAVELAGFAYAYLVVGLTGVRP